MKMAPWARLVLDDERIWPEHLVEFGPDPRSLPIGSQQVGVAVREGQFRPTVVMAEQNPISATLPRSTGALGISTRCRNPTSACARIRPRSSTF
jgi:hypothetical protein